MVGKPKFKEGDKVKFVIDNKELIGEVYIIDAYGTFFDDSDVYYDIMVEGNPYNTLYKHIKESGLEKN